MIKVRKNFKDIPNILTIEPTRGISRKEAFKANISASNYVDDNNGYKVGSVQKKLNEIYHLKCGYCEKKLLDSPKHIEHYRPKKGGYYWLAYSWDNLLLSCGECNSHKLDKVPIAQTKAEYNSESFEDIHNLGDDYDELEKPYIINPEKEDILDKLTFDKKGVIDSDDERVLRTIDICKLNREPLAKLREEVFVDFLEEMEGHYQYYKLKKDVTRFIPTVKQFIDNCQKEHKFYAFRYFILNNIEIFFDNRILQNILIKIIDKKTS